jgi:hypothetical protein
MSGRVYTVSFSQVAVTAAQDLISIATGAKAIKLHSVQLGQYGATAVGNLPIAMRRLGPTAALGSGGSAVTPVPMNPGDAAATVTAHVNDTTNATTSGGTVAAIADDFNVINGYLHMPPEADRIIVGPNSALTIALLSAPAAAETMSGTATFEELY